MKKFFSLSLFLFVAVLTASAQLGNILLPTASPASGSTVESLKKVTLTFPVEYVSWGYDAISVTDASGANVADVYLNGDIMNTNVAYVILSDEITTPGTYTIAFPKGFFYETESDFYTTTGKATEALTLTYTVETPKNVLNFTADPENKSSVDKLDKVILTFDTDMIDGMAGYGDFDQWGADAKQIGVFDANGDSITNIVWGYTSDYTQMALNLADAITTSGTYTFTLPEGYVWEYDDNYTATGKKTKETTFIYTVNAPATLTCTADPANGSAVEKLLKITLTFPTDMVTGAGEYAADAQWSSFGKQIPVYDADGTEFSSLTWSYGISDYDLVLTLSTAITADGTYTFTLPKGFASEVNYSWEEVQITPEMTFTYTIGTSTDIAVVTPITHQPTPNSYNLAGQRVNANAKGIIIMNGKKFINK